MTNFSLKNIQKSFGANRVLNDISLSLQPGSVTAIVGDNGAGKSTLLKVMSGTLSPDSGQVLLGERELSLDSSEGHRSQGIEMVYQDLALAKQHDVVSNLFVGRELLTSIGFLNRRGMIHAATEALSQIGIEIEDILAPVKSLSGGQQQAIAIARAIMFNPKVLLLDEPTAALAEREVLRVLDIIRQQRSQGRTIVLVSHRLNDVFAVADRIIAMKQGTVMANLCTDATTVNHVIELIVS